jgi:hypothetical protein
MRHFNVAHKGETLLIKNVSERTLKLISVTVKYGITVDTLDGQGIRNIGDEMRLDKDLGSGESIEIPIKLPDPTSVILVFRDGEIFRREDISI